MSDSKADQSEQEYDFNSEDERLTAVHCLRNAHGHIAVAYAKLDGGARTPEHWRRSIHETLDAVDWIRRALEHMESHAA